jgi:6-phosphogluconolactonase
MKLHRFDDAAAAARACADSILERLEQAIAERDSAFLAISGGSSPRIMFEIFARRGFSWDRVHLFWVDERVVPPTDPQSNYKLAADTWLIPAKFPAANVHRVVTELGAEPAAERYTEEIRSHLRPANPLPCFDVIHRGMGPDGHTASLFPGEPLIADHGGIAAAVWVEKMHQWRVTLLPGVLESARRTVMLVTGADKTAMLKTVLSGDLDPNQYPVQIASLGEQAEWFVDAAAHP